MDWRDEGILLTARRHGESTAIVEVLHRRARPPRRVVRGGAGRRMAPVLQPGSRLSLEWSARLEEHIGAFRVDPIARADGGDHGRPAALAALGAVTALIVATLPERDAHPDLYARSRELIEALAPNPTGPRATPPGSWRCSPSSASGSTSGPAPSPARRDDLVWVSPQIRPRRQPPAAGAPWADRPASRFPPVPGVTDWRLTAQAGRCRAPALALTGFFLARPRRRPGLSREKPCRRPAPAARGGDPA